MGSIFILTLTVNGVTNSITHTLTKKAKVVQTSDKISKNIKLSEDITSSPVLNSFKNNRPIPEAKQAPTISNFVILKEGIVLTYLPFKTVNSEAKNADMIPKVIPNTY